MIKFLEEILRSSFEILNSASIWLIFSFLLAGFLRNILNPLKFQKMLGNTKLSSILKSTLSGMLLPICSCGVIPLGMSMYFSGAYLGPVLAFMTSTPMINPVAILLAFGLLGPKIAGIYVLTGFCLPFLIGIIGNKFGKDELHAPGMEEFIESDYDDDRSFKEKTIDGFNWAFNDLALVVSKYVILGMVMAGFLFTVFPKEYIEKYLGDPSVLSLGSITILAMIMYVCAVGHIPFIAALVASGAAPGVAVTFLMAGTATNLPELLSMYKLMGKRTVIIYSLTMVLSSLGVGYLTNILLFDFKPVIDFDKNLGSIEAANFLLIEPPEYIKYLCSIIIILLAVKAIYPTVKKRVMA